LFSLGISLTDLSLSADELLYFIAEFPLHSLRRTSSSQLDLRLQRLTRDAASALAGSPLSLDRPASRQKRFGAPSLRVILLTPWLRLRHFSMRRGLV